MPTKTKFFFISLSLPLAQECSLPLNPLPKTLNPKPKNSISHSLAQWFVAHPRALSYSNNSLLTPGLDISKPYPVNSTGTVTFQAVPIPGTLPQRFWYVFSPPAGNTSGGYIYYQGESGVNTLSVCSYLNNLLYGTSTQIGSEEWIWSVIEVMSKESFTF